jgi:hypothetical protein
LPQALAALAEMRLHEQRPSFRESAGAVGVQELTHVVAVPNRTGEDFVINLNAQSLRSFCGGGANGLSVRHIGL